MGVKHGSWKSQFERWPSISEYPDTPKQSDTFTPPTNYTSHHCTALFSHCFFLSLLLSTFRVGKCAVLCEVNDKYR